MLRCSEAKKAKLSKEIEMLMNTDLKNKIGFFVNKYKAALEHRLGLTEADLVGEMRMQIWKGLLAYSKTKGANKKTYLSNLIQNRFYTLYRQSRLKKHASIDYFPDPSVKTSASSAMTTEVTGETLLIERENAAENVGMLINPLHSKILADLTAGCNLESMMANHELTRAQVIKAVREISEIFKNER